MYLNPLILDQKHVGFDELVRGNPTSAIRLIENLVKTCSANAETSKAAYRYMLLYATYSFPYLDLGYVTALCKTYQWAIEDAATQNLISERLNSRWRQEYYQLLYQANASDSSKSIVPDVNIEDDVTLTGPLSNDDMKQALVDVDIVFLNNRVVPDYSLLSEIPFGSLSSSLVPTWFGCGTDGYIVTRRGAQKLLELEAPLKAHISVSSRTSAHQLFDVRESYATQFQPRIVGQRRPKLN